MGKEIALLPLGPRCLGLYLDGEEGDGVAPVILQLPPDQEREVGLLCGGQVAQLGSCWEEGPCSCVCVCVCACPSCMPTAGWQRHSDGVRGGGASIVEGHHSNVVAVAW